jgi:peroxiredoxin family protein
MMPNPEAINMMILSNDYAKIHAAAMLAAVGATFGKPIKIFVSMEALPAFHKDPAVSDAVTKGPVARKIVETGGATFLDLFQQGKEFGEVTIYACSMVMDLYHWTLADLADVFDETLGVAGFLAMVEGETTFTL